MNHQKKALVNLNRVINQDPGNPKAIARRGATYHLLERYEEAIADFNQALALKPNYAWCMLHRAETYRHMARYPEALADFNRAVALRPNDAWAVAHRGMTYCLTDCYSEALADFNRALDLQPDYAWAWAHRGATYRFMKQYRRALPDLNRAVDLQPNYAWAIAYRSAVYMLLKQYRQGWADFEQALALDPAVVKNAHADRGLFLTVLGRYTEAVEFCRRALQENPDNHIALYYLAVANTHRLGLAQAQVDINKARAALLPRVSMAMPDMTFYKLGGLAALEGNTNQALDYLQQAVSLEGGSIKRSHLYVTSEGIPSELAQHDVAWLNLRDDPRFQELVGYDQVSST